MNCYPPTATQVAWINIKQALTDAECRAPDTRVQAILEHQYLKGLMAGLLLALRLLEEADPEARVEHWQPEPGRCDAP